MTSVSPVLAEQGRARQLDVCGTLILVLRGAVSYSRLHATVADLVA